VTLHAHLPHPQHSIIDCRKRIFIPDYRKNR